jgi:predicted nuclease of predicted toxin-antitoxin system
LRFFIDQCLSSQLADGLVAAGHDAVHAAAYGLSRAADEEILARAAAEQRVLISADTDFGGMLVARESTVPSVILYRRQGRRRPHEQVMILLANMPALEEDLDAGAIVVIENRGIRIRRLPIGG